MLERGDLLRLEGIAWMIVAQLSDGWVGVIAAASAVISLGMALARDLA